ncbi:hypothetical protein BaRGS_00003785, partial [Batillaria attramentaria]
KGVKTIASDDSAQKQRPEHLIFLSSSEKRCHRTCARTRRQNVRVCGRSTRARRPPPRPLAPGLTGTNTDTILYRTFRFNIPSLLLALHVALHKNQATFFDLLSGPLSPVVLEPWQSLETTVRRCRPGQTLTLPTPLTRPAYPEYWQQSFAALAYRHIRAGRRVPG